MSAWLLDPRRKDGSFPFEYRNSASTDVRETFERIRREQQANQQEAAVKVKTIQRRKP